MTKLGKADLVERALLQVWHHAASGRAWRTDQPRESACGIMYTPDQQRPEWDDCPHCTGNPWQPGT